jgi:hypothetical protein
MERVLGGFAEAGDGHEVERSVRDVEDIVEYKFVGDDHPDAEGVYRAPLETMDRMGRDLAELKEVLLAV